MPAKQGQGVNMVQVHFSDIAGNTKDNRRARSWATPPSPPTRSWWTRRAWRTSLKPISFGVESVERVKADFAAWILREWAVVGA